MEKKERERVAEKNNEIKWLQANFAKVQQAADKQSCKECQDSRKEMQNLGQQSSSEKAQWEIERREFKESIEALESQIRNPWLVPHTTTTQWTAMKRAMRREDEQLQNGETQSPIQEHQSSTSYGTIDRDYRSEWEKSDPFQSRGEPSCSEQRGRGRGRGYHRGLKPSLLDRQIGRAFTRDSESTDNVRKDVVNKTKSSERVSPERRKSESTAKMKPPTPLNDNQFRVEEEDKRMRRNNVCVRFGKIKMLTSSDKVIQEIESKTGVIIRRERIRFYGDDMFEVLFDHNTDKKRLMAKRGNLKGTEIWLDEDFTPRERQINVWLKHSATEEEREGRPYEVAYGRVLREGVWWRWSERRGRTGANPVSERELLTQRT